MTADKFNYTKTEWLKYMLKLQKQINNLITWPINSTGGGDSMQSYFGIKQIYASHMTCSSVNKNALKQSSKNYSTTCFIIC